MENLNRKLLISWFAGHLFIFLYGLIEMDYLKTEIRWILYFTWLSIGVITILIKAWMKKEK